MSDFAYFKDFLNIFTNNYLHFRLVLLELIRYH